MQKTILITGCSSGIGKAACYYLKNRGYRVFATARKEQDVAVLQKEGFESFVLDVMSTEHIISVIDEVLVRTGGTLYALCNNAGYGQPGALDDINRSSLRQQFETNVFGLQELTNKVLPIFRKQGYGRIIHISSVLGIVSLPFRGAYSASKYAVEALADTLRLELRGTNIFISLILPGPIQTKFRENAFSAYKTNVDTQKSVHQKEYKGFLSYFKRDESRVRFSAKPELVAKEIAKALESHHPKARYYATFPVYLFVILKRVLPQRLLDLILAKIARQEIE